MKLFFEERLAVLVIIACGILGALWMGYIRYPQVFLLPRELNASDAITVLVAGAVEHPGEYRVRKGSLALEAAHAAGSGGDAALDYLNSTVPLVEGEVVYVPSRSESALDAESKREEILRRWRQPLQVRPFDLNSASLEELATVPGVGEKLAMAIVLKRRSEPFRSVDELKTVAGIGGKKFEQIKDYFIVKETAE
ncbi:MAG: helix-hairpin-helix domain-containing protein [Candidatus Aureabacteria bacterium]|nr:helix-hairpin-helix domain-containing protein [Candidatus Auribacterota bacterium]